MMNITVNLNKKFFAVFSILTLCAYGFMVSAVGPFTPGEMLDPTSSDGCSGPTDTDCIVRQAWTQNVASSYVYNTTESIGIGDATPAAALTVGNGDLFQVNSSGAIAASTGIATSGGYIQSGTTANTFTGTSTFSNATYSALFTGGNVGVGIATPTAKLQVKGSDDLVTTANVLFENSSGTDLFIVRNTGTLESVATHTGLVAGTNKEFNSFTSTLTPDASVDNSEYYGIKSHVTYDPTSTGFDLAYSSPGAAAITESSRNIQSGFFLTTLAGTGDVARGTGVSSETYISGTGSHGIISGQGNLLVLGNSATVASGYGMDNQVVVLAGTITRGVAFTSSMVTYAGAMTTAVGNMILINGDPAGSGTKRIVDALGMEIIARNASSTASGITMWTDLTPTPDTSAISSVTTAYGMRVDSLGSAVAAIDSATTYGIFMSAGSLNGSTAEYGIYIGDIQAQNYFANGFRIGADSDDNKIDNATSGSASTVMYIGTNTINTTAPSDERTKTDITETTYGLDNLLDINIIDFTYNQSIINDNNQRHSGVLAQQVQSIYPEAVSTRTDGYLMVDYRTFIPLIIKSVQELSLELDTIQSVANGLNTPSGLIAWLGDVTNGIVLIVADTVKARSELCIDDVCITRDQLADLLDNNGMSPVIPDEPEPISEPVPETDPVPGEDVPLEDVVPEPEPTPESEPQPDPIPESVPETSSVE